MSALELAVWGVTIAVAAGCAWAILNDRPGLALGVLAAVASFSGVTAPIGEVGVRMEQPAVLLMAAILLVRRPASVQAMLRAARWPIAFAGIYLGVNVASALVNAPDSAQSLKICLWLALSLLAAGVAALLVFEARAGDADRNLVVWLVAAGCLHTVVAVTQVVGELWFGTDWGVLRGDAPVGKAFGLAWEPNLLAINLAAALMFLLDPTTGRRFTDRVRLGAIVTISAGIALALSRGGLVAMAAGLGVLAVSLTVTPRSAAFSRYARNLAGEAALAFAIAIGGYAALAVLGSSGVGVRPGDTASAPITPDESLIPIASSASGTGPPSSGVPGPEPTPTPKPSPSGHGANDASANTVVLRWRNLQIAVADGLTSPLIGLGPDTFGQRYGEPTCQCPAHIPNQLSATFYETGLIGLLSLLALIGLVLVRAWQVRLTAYVASLVVLVVGYQFTDAMRFASLWVILGAAIGLIVVATGTVAGPFSRAPTDKR
jgi:hypothetical protein